MAGLRKEVILYGSANGFLSLADNDVSGRILTYEIAACVWLLLFWCAANIQAQQTSASIEGRVVDPQGAIYNLPKLAGFLDNAIGRVVLNGWEFSGFTAFTSGAPASVSYSISGVAGTTLNRQITGSETLGARPVLTGNINLQPGDRTIEAWFKTGVLQPATRGTQGADSAQKPLRGPGVSNFDLSLFKNNDFAR